MIHSKKIYITAMMAVAVLLFNACKNAPHDEVFSTYDNGQPKLVFTVVDKKDGKKERLAEKFYYENGQPMYEKHFKDNKPTGTWKFFYNNGQLHAQGSFDGTTPSAATGNSTTPRATTITARATTRSSSSTSPPTTVPFRWPTAAATSRCASSSTTTTASTPADWSATA